MHLSHRQYTTRLSQKLQRWLHRKSRRLSEVRPEMAAASRLGGRPCQCRVWWTGPWLPSECPGDVATSGGPGFGKLTRGTSGDNLPPSEVIMSRCANTSAVNGEKTIL